MCAGRAQSDQGELYLNYTALASGSGERRRHRFSVTVQHSWLGGSLQDQSGTHPPVWKPRASVSYQADHPLPSDSDCQATAGHSQAAAACGDASTYRHWLNTTHPRLVESVDPWGEGIYSACTHRSSQRCTNTDLITSIPVCSDLPGPQPARRRC